MASAGCPLLHPPPESTGPSQFLSVAGGTPWYGLTTVHISINLPRGILVVSSFEQSCCEHSCKGNKEATLQNVEGPQLTSKGLTVTAHSALELHRGPSSQSTYLSYVSDAGTAPVSTLQPMLDGQGNWLKPLPPPQGSQLLKDGSAPAHLGPGAQPTPGTRSGSRKDLALGT